MSRLGPQNVLPPMWSLPQTHWGYGWCKLDEMCGLARDLSQQAGTNINFTPETLVHMFAAFIQKNNKGRQRKLFRYSVDGTDFRATEVPDRVPFEPFELGVGAPYPLGLFVPAGWALDTLDAIR